MTPLALLAAITLAPAAPAPAPVASLTQGDTMNVEAPWREGGDHRITLVPKTCGNADGTYDVLVHFHGVHTVIEPQFAKSKLNAVLAIVNLGEFSGPYERHFAVPGTFNQLLSAIDRNVQEHCPGQRAGRVAISGWSGGYGAPYRILSRAKEAARVDALLLADGLHAGFTDQRKRSINDLQMEPFLRFAQQAKRGEKFFAVTHTQIGTPYASTTDTSNYLVAKLGLSRTRTREAGPRAGMLLTSTASQNGFEVFGFSGDGKRDHCNHLWAIGDTLFARLRDHWSGVRYQAPQVEAQSTVRVAASELAPRHLPETPAALIADGDSSPSDSAATAELELAATTGAAQRSPQRKNGGEGQGTRAPRRLARKSLLPG
jgi:hypothetical protein